MSRCTRLSDPNTAEVIDRITRDQLEQLDLQIQVAHVLLGRAPKRQREEVLNRLAALRDRVIRLRAELLGTEEDDDSPAD